MIFVPRDLLQHKESVEVAFFDKRTGYKSIPLDRDAEIQVNNSRWDYRHNLPMHCPFFGKIRRLDVYSVDATKEWKVLPRPDTWSSYTIRGAQRQHSETIRIVQIWMSHSHLWTPKLFELPYFFSFNKLVNAPAR